MELYPSLKPLPTPEKVNVKEGKPPPGAVRQRTYERQCFQKAFAKLIR